MADYFSDHFRSSNCTCGRQRCGTGTFAGGQAVFLWLSRWTETWSGLALFSAPVSVRLESWPNCCRHLNCPGSRCRGAAECRSNLWAAKRTVSGQGCSIPSISWPCLSFLLFSRTRCWPHGRLLSLGYLGWTLLFAGVSMTDFLWVLSRIRNNGICIFLFCLPLMSVN